MSDRKIIEQLRADGFTVLTRRQWGSKHRAVYQWRRVNRHFVGAADHAFGHITVTTATKDAKADARQVEAIGQSRFGSGVSYNWLLHKPSKTIIVGQPLDAAGTHTVNDKNVAGFHDNLNYWGHAIGFIGQPGDGFDDWCRDAAAAIIRAEKKHGGMKSAARLYPHSKFAFKDCPCDPYRDSIPEIEKKAALSPLRQYLQRLRESRKRGLAWPGKVTVRVVNLASVSFGPAKVVDILDNALKGDPGLVLAVECGDIRIREHIDTDKWQVVQFGSDVIDQDERVPLAGNALIARRGVVKLERARLDVGSPGGEGIRTRYVLSVKARFRSGLLRWTRTVKVGHAPPKWRPSGGTASSTCSTAASAAAT